MIATDVATLSHAAFDVAPAKAVEHGGGVDAIAVNIAARRLGAEPRGGLLDFLEDALEGVHLRLHVVQLGGYLA